MATPDLNLRGGPVMRPANSFTARPALSALLGTIVATLLGPAALRADVLVVGAPSSGAPWLADVQSKILQTGVIAGNVDVFDARVGTPTLAQLSAYEAVLFFGDASFQNSTLLGNVLADYVDAGGGAVETTFALQSSGGLAIGGRWRSGGYDPLIPGPQSQGVRLTLGTLYLPDHPILSGVTDFDGGSSSYHNVVGGLSPGSERVADWSNGRPLVAANTTRFNGRTAALNFYPPSSDVRFDFWSTTTDGALLLANALRFVSRQSCFVIDAIDDQFAVINDGSTTEFRVLDNEECDGDEPISVVTLPGDLQPDRGGVAVTDGNTVRYTPATGQLGFEEFTYTARDAGLEGGDDPPSVDQDSARVVVNLLEDLIPDAVDDSVTTLQTQTISIDVLANDSEGNPSSELTIDRPPANGIATLQPDRTIRYQPDSTFFGEDTFDYRLTDANGDSDVATVTVGVFFVRGAVTIDIKPKDAGNNLNLRSGPGSGFEVAILSVGVFFDAPALVDPLTLKLGPRQANIWGTARIQDVDGDGDDDLVVKFLTQQTGIACGDTSASLTGRTFDLQSISGFDAVNTFNCPRVRKRY